MINDRCAQSSVLFCLGRGKDSNNNNTSAILYMNSTETAHNCGFTPPSTNVTPARYISRWSIFHITQQAAAVGEKKPYHDGWGPEGSMILRLITKVCKGDPGEGGKRAWFKIINRIFQHVICIRDILSPSRLSTRDHVKARWSPRSLCPRRVDGWIIRGRCEKGNRDTVNNSVM